MTASMTGLSATETPTDGATSNATLGATGTNGTETNECLAPEDYGASIAIADSKNFAIDGHYTFIADLVPPPARFQRLFVVLHPERGLFPGDVAPGSFTLTGDETDYASCSACVYVAIDDDGKAPSVLYMATSGTLVIDDVDSEAGEMHGSLSDGEFVEIELVYEGEPCGDDQPQWNCGNAACSDERCGVQREVATCTTRIGILSF